MKNEKPNILLLFWGRRGAIARCTQELAQALRARENVTPHLSLSRQSELFETTQALGIPGCHVNTYHSALSALCSLPRIPFESRRVARYIRGNHIQAVVCLMNHLWNPVAIPILKKTGALYFTAIHDPVRHIGEQNRFLDRIQTFDVKNADRVLVFSRFAREELLKTYPFVRPENILIMPIGAFDFGHASQQPRPAARHPARMLFFGRIREYKGIDLLLDAYMLAREKIPELQLQLVGQGDLTPYHDRLRRAGTGVIVDNRWINESDIPALLDQADLLVLPYREATQSAAVPAALQKGVPCVVTPCGALSEQVAHEQTGLVATAVDAPSVAAAIQRLIRDTALYSRCSEEAIRLASSAFSWDDSARILEEGVQTALD